MTYVMACHVTTNKGCRLFLMTTITLMPVSLAAWIPAIVFGTLLLVTPVVTTYTWHYITRRQRLEDRAETNRPYNWASIPLSVCNSPPITFRQSITGVPTLQELVTLAEPEPARLA